MKKVMNCSICYEPIQHNKIIRCKQAENHFWCQSCHDKWDGTCPFCRDDYYKRKKKRDERKFHCRMKLLINKISREIITSMNKQMNNDNSSADENNNEELEHTVKVVCNERTYETKIKIRLDTRNYAN